MRIKKRLTDDEAIKLGFEPRPKTKNGGNFAYSFNEDKLIAGLSKALEKRPVSIEKLEEAVTRIKANLRSTGEREVRSRDVGEEVMKELRNLDEVAFVRFASVYRSFKDLNEFREEIDRLSQGKPE